MRCRIIRDDIEVSNAPPGQMLDQIVVKRVKRSGRMVDRTFWRNGAILKHPHAFRLVQQGVAIPEDDECRDACCMTTEGMAAAQYAYERLSRGIHPDDYAAYDAGYLSGYEPDGEWKPGEKGGRQEYLSAFGLDPDDEDLFDDE